MVEENKKERPKEEPKKFDERRVEKDLLKIIIFLAVLVLIYFVVSGMFQRANQFEYEGLSFTKERFGEIMVYHHYYYFNAPITGNLIRYNLFLKNDPRLNEVPVEIDNIYFPVEKDVFIAVDSSNVRECDDVGVAAATLSAFLTDNQLDVKGGTNDFIESALYGHDYYTCEDYPDNPVINIIRGPESKVSGSGNCMNIVIGSECNAIEVVEKFQVKSVMDAKERGDSS